MHLAWLLSGPLPLGNESNDLKILLLSFVATERRDGRWQQRCGQRDRESRLSPTRSIGRLPKPADWKRRLRRRPSSATVHLFRQTVEVDIESVKSLFMAPMAGWLNRTHCHGVQREEGLTATATMPCLYTNRSLPDGSTSNADKCECRGCFDANFPRPTIERLKNL